MITNERQYKITKTEAHRFKNALRDFRELELVKQGIDPIIVSAQRSSLEQQLKDLEDQIAEYEKLRSGRITRLFPASVREIGQTLIEARITQGLSQRALAERLEIKEQQIQRYEQERYQTANLIRIAEVADALQLDLIAFFESRSESLLDKVAPNLKGGFDPSRLPIKEMKRRGWLARVRLPEAITGSLGDIDLAAAFVSQALTAQSLHREHIRTGSTQDQYALLAWKAQVLHRSRRVIQDNKLPSFSAGGLVTRLVQLSTRSDGPIEAIKLLREHGVVLIIENHLPGTHLDGAAMLLNDEIPVIGLTLRHDRLDNFWFTLLHELGHIFLHRERGLSNGFFDEEGASSKDELEDEADSFAESAFLPNEVWRKSFVRFAKSARQILEFAEARGVSSAIVAGRIRRERQDWSLFSDLVGQGSVQKLMSSAGYWED
jgi:HTH-type transcriptional regulator/antitoxin HigA